MYEAVWGEYQPQTWCYGTISTSQVDLTFHICSQLGWCNSIRVQPCALETAYQWLKLVLYVYHGCMKQSQVDISINHDILLSILLHKQPVTLSPQIWGQLGRCNCIRVHPYALETTYQWLKHFAYVYYECLKQTEVDISLNNDVMASFFCFASDPASPQIRGQPGQCNGIRVQPYSLETAYHLLKYFACV